MFGTETIFDPYLIGLLVGDGTYGGTSPCIFNADEEITSYIENNYDCVPCRKSHITKDGRVFKALRLRKVITHLRELGIQGQTGVNKRLPQKHYIFIFLKYFFNQTIYFIYSKIIGYP